MTSGQKALIVFIVFLAILTVLINIGFKWGQANMVSGMMADGLRLVECRECEVGEGRYTIQVWRGSWVDVER